MTARILCVLGLCLIVACDLPRDPEGTLARVQDGTLRVGYIENPPWVTGTRGEPQGVEADLIREFARELNAGIAWTPGTESAVMEALENFELDLVIGGITRSVPWARRVALTNPYHTTRISIAVPPATPHVQEVEGERIAVEMDDLVTASRLRGRGAIPVRVRDLSEVRGPVAAPHWKLSQIGFRETKIVLDREHQVMAVPPGENGFLVRLERFLLARRPLVEERLSRSSR